MAISRYDDTDIVIIGHKKTVKKIRENAKKSLTDPSTWAMEAIEWFIQEHRSGKYTPDPDRHSDRDTVEDEYHLMEDIYAEREEV